MKAEDIRLQFWNENDGLNWINSQDEPDIDYVYWLENKVLSLLSNKESEEEKECIEILKAKLEINAGRLVEPILKEGKNPKDDPECHKAFLALSHLQLIEKYLTSKY